MTTRRLTDSQQQVLDAMRQRNIVTADGGAVTSSTTDLLDRYNLFIHWRTAEALERRGLVKIHDKDGWSDEGYDVTLTAAGAEA